MDGGIPEKIAISCERVGRFLLHFSKLEQGVDEAIAKLFGMNIDQANILCANLDFNRKVNIVQSVASLQTAGKPEG